MDYTPRVVGVGVPVQSLSISCGFTRVLRHTTSVCPFLLMVVGKAGGRGHEKKFLCLIFFMILLVFPGLYLYWYATFWSFHDVTL